MLDDQFLGRGVINGKAGKAIKKNQTLEQIEA